MNRRAIYRPTTDDLAVSAAATAVRVVILKILATTKRKRRERVLQALWAAYDELAAHGSVVRLNRDTATALAQTKARIEGAAALEASIEDVSFKLGIR